MTDRGVMFQYFEWNLRADGSLWRELASRAAYLKKLGVAGFIFFLVKGLIWLFILLFLKSKL